MPLISNHATASSIIFVCVCVLPPRLVCSVGLSPFKRMPSNEVAGCIFLWCRRTCNHFNIIYWNSVTVVIVRCLAVPASLLLPIFRFRIMFLKHAQAFHQPPCLHLIQWNFMSVSNTILAFITTSSRLTLCYRLSNEFDFMCIDCMMWIQFSHIILSIPGVNNVGLIIDSLFGHFTKRSKVCESNSSPVPLSFQIIAIRSIFLERTQVHWKFIGLGPFKRNSNNNMWLYFTLKIHNERKILLQLCW